jgi:hypothetical protein
LFARYWNFSHECHFWHVNSYYIELKSFDFEVRLRIGLMEMTELSMIHQLKWDNGEMLVVSTGEPNSRIAICRPPLHFSREPLYFRQVF